ncbi:protein AMBP-like isoform X2 [Anoplopoma fimbria]|uniref:protein AMBP-like isoform X2 n=1 Tax=Anoplopoma fimbria TaxID=229290 RepID=UPI0023EC967B|nr:protein AMBP-like isoform X2 [Anoplopoma fimbria]
MQRVVSLWSLLVLGSACMVQAVPVILEPLVLTQENFDLARFMGKWFEVAVVSTCPHYMQRKRGNPVIVALELQHVASDGNFTMTATSFRNGSCKKTSTDYSLTNTPGRFFHHVARFAADVDSFVVHSNYDEYAMLLLLSIEKPSGNKTTSFKLYSRSMSVRPTVLDDFKTLVRQHGVSDEAIIMNQNKGVCVPGEQVTEPVTAQPQMEKKYGATCGSCARGGRW